MFGKVKYLFLVICITLSGCTSVAKGVTEAILEQEKEDSRQCEIQGPSFGGVDDSFNVSLDNSESKQTKILMVHGISKHLPGYSTGFKNKLVKELGLNVSSNGYKEIYIRHNNYKDQNGNLEELGTLRISRHSNSKGNKELLFYELTWSQISDPEKQELAFDNSGEFAFRRAGINHTIKTFFNNTIPDLMVYRGSSKEKINFAVTQATCWTFSGDWDDLPNKGEHFCDIENNDYSKNISEDDYFFVTHSLGSRITVDTLSYAASLASDNLRSNSNIHKSFEALKNKTITVFMLSNQLPLLQLGRETPSIVGQHNKYCLANSKHYNKRMFNKLNLIAFSDPNDILSYPIPPNYADKYIDSRLCSNIINASINVTDVKNAFGVNFANPAEAHSGYHQDDRVIGIIVDGLNRGQLNPLVQDKCYWVETFNQR